VSSPPPLPDRPTSSFELDQKRKPAQHNVVVLGAEEVGKSAWTIKVRNPSIQTLCSTNEQLIGMYGIFS
jgi:hypothetical protein